MRIFVGHFVDQGTAGALRKDKPIANSINVNVHQIA
jgi:hypothetical protein